MSASNYSWVCFECRLVVRQPKTAKRVPLCVACHSDLYCLGYKVEVPPKDNLRGWRKLRDDCRELQLGINDERIVRKVRDAHAAERRIAELRTLPKNKDRENLITELKTKIPSLLLQPTRSARA